MTGRLANSVDPVLMPRFVASDQCLYCLLRPVFPDTLSKYGNLIKWKPSEIILDPP